MKNDFKQGIRLYNLIVSAIWIWLTTAGLGFLIGYLIDKAAMREDHLYLIIFGITFVFIGLISFFVSILKTIKKYEEQEKLAKIKKEEEANENCE